MYLLSHSEALAEESQQLFICSFFCFFISEAKKSKERTKENKESTEPFSASSLSLSCFLLFGFTESLLLNIVPSVHVRIIQYRIGA